MDWWTHGITAISLTGICAGFLAFGSVGPRDSRGVCKLMFVAASLSFLGTGIFSAFGPLPTDFFIDPLFILFLAGLVVVTIDLYGNAFPRYSHEGQ